VNNGEAHQPDATLGGAILPQIGLAFQESGQASHMRPLENILPTRERADLILEKGPEHAVQRVKLRKL
jgi:hypothetical protein